MTGVSERLDDKERAEKHGRCTSWDISRAPEPVQAIYDHGPPAEPSVRPAVGPETMLAFALGANRPLLAAAKGEAS